MRAAVARDPHTRRPLGSRTAMRACAGRCTGGAQASSSGRAGGAQASSSGRAGGAPASSGKRAGGAKASGGGRVGASAATYLRRPELGDYYKPTTT